MKDIDSYIDSDEFRDCGLISMLRRGKAPTSLTLLRYLSRSFVYPLHFFEPSAEATKELLDAGATPFHFKGRLDWEEIFMDDPRLYMPNSLRSTLNIAALIDKGEILQLLLDAGEKPNAFTHRFTHPSLDRGS